MRKKTLCALLMGFFLFSGMVSGQSPTHRGIFLEVGGTGGLASINYEKAFRQVGAMELLWRVGFTAFPVDPNNGNGIVIPTLVEGLIGESPHKLEVGLGHALTLTTKGRFFTNITPVLGYRFQDKAKRFYFRASYTPILSYLLGFQYQHWAGLSIGYTLKPASK